VFPARSARRPADRLVVADTGDRQREIVTLVGAEYVIVTDSNWWLGGHNVVGSQVTWCSPAIAAVARPVPLLARIGMSARWDRTRSRWGVVELVAIAAGSEGTPAVNVNPVHRPRCPVARN